MARNEYDYFRRRAAAERAMAARARDPAIAAVHDDLAGRYDVLVHDGDRHGSFAIGEASPA